MQTSVVIRKPDDWHLHLRDGEVMKSVVPHTASQFSRALIMPNLKPPVSQVADALAYRERILACTPQEHKFQPLMALYLTDHTSVEDVAQVAQSDVVLSFKLYPAGATTNSEHGVSNLLERCSHVLAAMEKHQVTLCLHGEVTDPSVDVFDREKSFIDQVLLPLRHKFPGLPIVFEHITTKEAADYVTEASGKIAATITPQHLLYSRNALFAGGLQPHWYCLPVLKRETHRLALIDAATSGNPKFFLGTDSAPHAKQAKEMSCGCAGCYTALHAVSLYATAFDQVGKLDRLENFASVYGAEFYGLPLSTEQIRLEKKSYTVPEVLPFGDTSLVPLAAGQVFPWSVMQ